LLQRTLRQVRTEKARDVRQHRMLVAAAVVALVAATLGGGVVLGRRTAPAVVGAPPTPSASAPASQVYTGTDPVTHATMTVRVTPAKGWVRVNAKVDGVQAGLRCQLVVVDRSGNRVVAGSWLTPGTQASVDGSALVARGDVASVDVVTFDNEKLISVPVV